MNALARETSARQSAGSYGRRKSMRKRCVRLVAGVSAGALKLVRVLKRACSMLKRWVMQ